MPREADALGPHLPRPPVEDPVEIRAASADDASRIGVVHVRTWQAAYRGQFPQEDLDALDPGQLGENWRRYLAAGLSDAEMVLVAEVQGTIVGFASAGPSRENDQCEGELRALYVLPEWWLRGVGRSLLAVAEEAMRAFDFERAILWVLETNEGARRFYEASGWSSDGASKPYERWSISRTVVRYRRALR